MIRLLVEDYCQNCPEFEADVFRIQAQEYFDGAKFRTETNTTVECKHSEKCRAIFEYAKRQFENKEKSK